MSFQIISSPNKRVAARFVLKARRSLQALLAATPEITQAEIARKLGVNRSVINRQLNGLQDISMARYAELAWALGAVPDISLKCERIDKVRNILPPAAPAPISFSPGHARLVFKNSNIEPEAGNNTSVSAAS